MNNGLLRAEWIKLWSVRSTYLALGIAALMAIGLGALDTSSVAHNWATMSAADKAGFDAASETFNGGQLGQLAFGVLGVLVISSEYGTGLIRTTLTATPNRAAVFTAKALLTAAVTFLIGELLCLATFLSGQAFLARAHLDVSLTDPGVARAVFCTGLFLCVLALVSLGLGGLLRHTAGGIAAMFALVFLAWPIARAMETWTYLPDHLLLANAIDVLTRATPPAGPHTARLPSAGQAWLDLVLYPMLFLALGAWRTTRDP
jgi:ABC-2 type transport system permease protein